MSKPKAVAGVTWPETGNGARSSTITGKRVLAAALRAAGTDTASAAADKLQAEKNWRFGYCKHFVALAKELADENAAMNIARAGLREANSLFEFHRTTPKKEGDNQLPMSSLQEYCTDPSTKPSSIAACNLYTGVVQGSRGFQNFAAQSFEVPYQGKAYRGEALAELVESWSATSSSPCDVSFCQSVREAIAHPEWFDLRGKVFVLIGATSEMGPLEHLLAAGATVVAIARCSSAKRNKWKPLIEKASNSPGRLVFPMSEPMTAEISEGMSKKQSSSLLDLSLLAGADATTQTPELINWLNSTEVVKEANGKAMSIYSGIYMDGEGFVRATMGMDAIVDGCMQRQIPKPNLLYIDTPSHAHLVSSTVKFHSQSNATTSFLPYRLLAAISVLKPNMFHETKCPDRVVLDALAVEQGPNYALAKLLQRFRAMVSHRSGAVVSVTNGPPALTDSVMHSPTMAVMMNNIHLFPPNTAMEPETVQALMTTIMVRDLNSKSSAARQCAHVMDLFMENEWDGGIWRSPYTGKSMGVYIFIRHYLLRFGIPLLIVLWLATTFLM